MDVDNTPSIVIEPDENDVHSTKLSSSFMLFCPIVPILMLPLAVTDEVIEVIVVNLVDPTAVFEDATPVICSVTVDPVAFVPVTVNVFPVSPAEQYILITAFKSFAFLSDPFKLSVPAPPGLLEVYKLSSSLTYNL